jgi:hypothetical protein
MVQLLSILLLLVVVAEVDGVQPLLTVLPVVEVPEQYFIIQINQYQLHQVLIQ